MDRKGLILLVYVSEECNVSHIKQKPDSLSFKILNDILSRCVALRCVALRCVALRCVALRCVA